MPSPWRRAPDQRIGAQFASRQEAGRFCRSIRSSWCAESRHVSDVLPPSAQTGWGRTATASWFVESGVGSRTARAQQQGRNDQHSCGNPNPKEFASEDGIPATREQSHDANGRHSNRSPRKKVTVVVRSLNFFLPCFIECLSAVAFLLSCAGRPRSPKVTTYAKHHRTRTNGKRSGSCSGGRATIARLRKFLPWQS